MQFFILFFISEDRIAISSFGHISERLQQRINLRVPVTLAQPRVFFSSFAVIKNLVTERVHYAVALSAATLRRMHA